MSLSISSIAMLSAFFSSEGTHYYTYFDETQNLSIDHTMIVVYDKNNSPEVPRFVQDINSEYALSSVPGFAYVKVDANSFQSISNIVEKLHDSRRYDFVSPVFLSNDNLPYIPTQHLMARVASDANPIEAEQLLLKLGSIEKNYSGIDNLYRVKTTITSGLEILDMSNELASMPIFEFVEPDAISWKKSYYIPNDPEFAQQWGLSQSNNHDMDAVEAWDITFGNEDVTVVILDSGIDQNHTDINQLPGQTFTGASEGGDPSNSCDNHGTAVAGCVSAIIDNNVGVVGVAPYCTVRAGKIFNEISIFGFCLGFLESQDSWTVNGITWSADVGAKVTNSSWGGGSGSASISTAFNETRAQGVLHIAAAGNDGSTNIGWPANLGSVNAVAAMASNGNLADFSTSGNGLFISAPGASIRTTDRMGGDGYGTGNTTTIDGTSFASPYVAGVAALVYSMNNSLSPDDVENVLATTAIDYGSTGYDTTFGHGFVNAFQAVASLDTPGCDGDVNSDNIVNISDVLEIINQWGTTNEDADVTGDGIVNVSDLLAAVANWGECS